jgi:hypothetical protein
MLLTYVTRRVPLVEQDLLILQEQLCSPRVLVRLCCSVFSLLCIVLLTIICPLDLFTLAFVWPVFPQFLLLITHLVSSNFCW